MKQRTTLKSEGQQDDRKRSEGLEVWVMSNSKKYEGVSCKISKV